MSTNFEDWKAHTSTVKNAFGALGKKYPEMLNGYVTLGKASAASKLDEKTRELIALAVATTTRCESCISVHAAKAAALGLTEEEIAGAIAVAVELNAGAAYTYGLRVLEAFEEQK